MGTGLCLGDRPRRRARGTQGIDHCRCLPGRSFAGWVGFISPSAEFTPKSVETTDLRSSLVYEVRVFVQDSADELRLGSPATVHLAPGAASAPKDEASAGEATKGERAKPLVGE